MSLERIQLDVENAASQFAMVELRRRADTSLYVKTALQTAAGNVYVVSIDLQNYPAKMPSVVVERPAIDTSSPHRYNDGRICYLHHQMWNPAKHDITFVIARAAKWLNKYEVWRQKRDWPGEQILH